MSSRFADSAALSIPDTIMRNPYVANYQAIQVAMIGTQLFGVRLAVMLAFSPLFAVAYLVAMSDGLVQRSIRCAGGGNVRCKIGLAVHSELPFCLVHNIGKLQRYGCIWHNASNRAK